VKLPACKVNVTELAPEATVTEAGALSTLLTMAMVIDAPEPEAAEDSVTVQVLEVDGARVVGVHEREDTPAGATRLTAAVTEPVL
jgi:hypothetical protein